MLPSSRRSQILLAACCIAVAALLLLGVDNGPVSSLVPWVASLLRSELHPLFFVLLMIALPLAGFPISIFLVLAGVRFGPGWGVVLTFFVLPLHITTGYLVTRTFLRNPLLRFLSQRGYEPPILYRRQASPGIVGFLLMPGPPYILKTYLLALTGLPFKTFLLTNWATESLLTLPIVAMGGAAAQKNWYLFGALLVAFLASVGYRWHRKRHRGS
jgi:uncharacterized membrane protein YdjX (TVP38/TMEM64 family)